MLLTKASLAILCSHLTHLISKDQHLCQWQFRCEAEQIGKGMWVPRSVSMWESMGRQNIRAFPGTEWCEGEYNAEFPM